MVTPQTVLISALNVQRRHVNLEETDYLIFFHPKDLLNL